MLCVTFANVKGLHWIENDNFLFVQSGWCYKMLYPESFDFE